MPHASICVECGRIAPTKRGRCPECARRSYRDDYYQSPEWRRLRKRFKERFTECAICGSSDRLTPHHKQARKAGGPDEEANLIPLCGSCHSSYEANLRYDRDTELRRLVEAL